MQLYTSIQPENILVHTGAEEAIYLFMHAMLKDNDHVIVHAPHYQSLSEVAKGIGCQVSPWIAREENGWALDLNELRHLMRTTTKAVIINTPHNPTGYLMSRADFDELNKFVQEEKLLLFSDEVYRESEYDPAARLPAACDYGEHAVSLGVTSKTYGLGWSADWLDCHKKQKMCTKKWHRSKTTPPFVTPRRVNSLQKLPCGTASN